MREKQRKSGKNRREEEKKKEKTICVNLCNLWTGVFIRGNSCHSWATFVLNLFRISCFKWRASDLLIIGGPKAPGQRSIKGQTRSIKRADTQVCPYGNLNPNP